MTVNELRNILDRINSDGNGDNKIRIQVTDCFKVHGVDAEIRNPRLNDFVWGNFLSNRDAKLTTMTIDLDRDLDHRLPCITFRK